MKHPRQVRKVSATLPTLANEKPAFLKNICTKNDAAKECRSKRTTDEATGHIGNPTEFVKIVQWVIWELV